MLKPGAVHMVKMALMRMGRQDSLYDDLYRRVAASFGMSVCEMWIFYFMLAAKGGVTQQDVASMMMFPKQTVNSAVAHLVKDGMVLLKALPNARNSKKIAFTRKGRNMACKTVNHLLQSEIRATQKLGGEKTIRYISLRDEYYQFLKSEFESDFLKDE